MDIEEANSYINELYKEKSEMSKKNFIEHTKLKHFIPVVDEEVARYLQVMIQIKKPKRILEIGTSIGYSTTAMAQIVKTYGGKITTIEYDEQAAKQANENFKAAQVDKIIELKFGDARKIIKELIPGYDMIFQDVDKHLYPELFNDCVQLLNKEGLLIAEDTLFPILDLEERWQNLIEPIKVFNQLVIECDQLESTILPIGDGVTVAMKK